MPRRIGAAATFAAPCAERRGRKNNCYRPPAINRRLNRDNRDVATKRALLFNGCPDGTQRSSATMPGNSTKEVERCKRSQRKKCWKSKAATGPMLPRDLCTQLGQHWRCSYCCRHASASDSFYRVGVIGGEVEAVLGINGTPKVRVVAPLQRYLG